MENNNIDTNLLSFSFWQTCEELIKKMEDDGYTIRLVSGKRTPREQAKIWRNGRASYLIKSTIKNLRDKKQNAIADLVEDVGPQMGKHVLTQTLPGYSWHNWGEAIDVWVNDDASGSDANYQPLAIAAKALNLTPGYYFHFRDPGHIQQSSFEIRQRFSDAQVNEYVKNNPG